MHPLHLTLNGEPVTDTVADDRLLIEWLREERGLTGVHQGCDTAQCGACTILIDGAAVKACNLLALQAQGSAVTTIEGLASPDEALTPIQLAFSQHHALQCGYCTPGMILRAVAMAGEGVPADADAVREALAGNLCRCTGYAGIVEAIVEVLPLLRSREGQP